MRKHHQLSLAQGAFLSTVGLVSGLIAWQVVFAPLQLPLKIILLLYAYFSLWFFSHDLTHHVVGRLGGIKFQYYLVGRSAITKLKFPVVSRVLLHIPILILKIERKSIGEASPRARRWMHVSGALVSMFLPWLIIPSSYGIGPSWVGYFFTIVVVGNDLFTLYFSPKTGDIYRARRVKG